MQGVCSCLCLYTPVRRAVSRRVVLTVCFTHFSPLARAWSGCWGASSQQSACGFVYSHPSVRTHLVWMYALGHSSMFCDPSGRAL